MGVKGLWRLILPTGRRISIETLTGKRLAIDASIWLTQFIKANRDPETGAVRPAAHLIGFLRRICKLLYHGIRPIFVFDGATPQIKLREVRARRDRREKLKSFGVVAGEGDDEGVKRMARRLLVANLKKQKEIELASNRLEDGKKVKDAVKVVKAAGAFTSSFNIAGEKDSSSVVDLTGPEASSTEKNEVKTSANNEKEYNALIEETRDFLKNVTKNNDPPPKSDWDKNPQDVIDVAGESQGDDDDDSYQIPENEEDFDTDTLYSLPSHMRKDVIEKLKRQQRLNSRSEFMSVAANPESYSQVQLKNFLKSSSLNKKIMDVGKNIAEESNGVVGEKIASDSNVRFIFEKDDDCETNQSKNRKRESKSSLEMTSMKRKRLKRLDGQAVSLRDLGLEASSSDDDDMVLQQDHDEIKKDHGPKSIVVIESDEDEEGGFVHNINLIDNLTSEDDPVEQKVGWKTNNHYDGHRKSCKPKIIVESSDDEEGDTYVEEKRFLHDQQQGSDDDVVWEDGSDVDTEEEGGFIRNREQECDDVVPGDNRSDNSVSNEGGGVIRNKEQKSDEVIVLGDQSDIDASDEGGGFIRDEEKESDDDVVWEDGSDVDGDEGGFIRNQGEEFDGDEGRESQSASRHVDKGYDFRYKKEEGPDDVIDREDRSASQYVDEVGGFRSTREERSDDDVAWEDGSDIESADEGGGFTCNKDDVTWEPEGGKEEIEPMLPFAAAESSIHAKSSKDTFPSPEISHRPTTLELPVTTSSFTSLASNEIVSSEVKSHIEHEVESKSVKFDDTVKGILYDEVKRKNFDVGWKENFKAKRRSEIEATESLDTKIKNRCDEEDEGLICNEEVGPGEKIALLKDSTQKGLSDEGRVPVFDQVKDSDMMFHHASETGIENENATSSHSSLFSASTDRFLDDGQGQVLILNSEIDRESSKFEKEASAFGQLENENNANRIALQRAHQTAANLTDWAGRAVRRAIAAHLDEKESQSAHNSTNESSILQVKEHDSEEDTGNNAITDDSNGNKSVDRSPSTELDDFNILNIEEEAERMRLESLREKRDIDTVTDDMVEDVMHLLNICGIPYIKAPAEAEAQCTELEKMGLADGVVTEDSDGECK